jgi:phosphoserine phosphatase RsbX
MHSGIVGHHLPKLRPSTIAIQANDVIAMATDGIHSEFDAHISVGVPPQQAAEQVLAHCGKTSDDALVLIGRWIGLNDEH